MITIQNLSKSYGGQTLFENVSLQINHGDRLAIVGANGTGKSTMFKMILGMESLDGGDLIKVSGLQMGYLPQETPHLKDQTALYEVLGGETVDNRREALAKKILMGLGFRISDFTRPVLEFSGGWQMRVMIAKLLWEAPDILMLDEPTNHLDLESLLWFQDYLRSIKSALLIISHDREFINATTTKIVELDRANLRVYQGNYETYLDQKKAEEERLIKAYKLQQKEIEELETYINRFRAKASLAASVQSKIKYLEKMEKIVIPPDVKTVGFSFPQPERSGQIVMDLKNIKFSYDKKNPVYDGLSLSLERGQKIALVGPNGAGKSTLLKILAGLLPIQGGTRKLGYNTVPGYFSQSRADMFQVGRTVFDEAKDIKRAHSETGIRTILGSFLFSGDAVNKNVEVLSGGEKSRLGLVKILFDPPNLFLMDEPTTHLDMASVQVLIDALKSYTGTFVFISHDVYFIRQLADNVLHVNQGKVTHYPGDYDYFLHKIALEDTEEAELFRSEERIEAAQKGRHLLSKSDSGEGKKASEAPQIKKHNYKTKEQKRQEAEDRIKQSRERRLNAETEQKKSTLLREESDILKDLADPATHQNPTRVMELSRRLGEIKKMLHER